MLTFCNTTLSSVPSLHPVTCIEFRILRRHYAIASTIEECIDENIAASRVIRSIQASQGPLNTIYAVSVIIFSIVIHIRYASSAAMRPFARPCRSLSSIVFAIVLAH